MPLRAVTHVELPTTVAGKNIFDFVDPEIEAKLAELEEEEDERAVRWPLSILLLTTQLMESAPRLFSWLLTATPHVFRVAPHCPW